MTIEDIRDLSDAEKCIAWNEIVAANNGYVFKNSGLRDYFNSCSWYTPDPNASASGGLSGVASENVTLLQENTSEWWRHLATY